MLKENLKIREYTLLEPLGSGGFGDVWKAEKQTGDYVALKFIRPKNDIIDLTKIRKEVAVWKNLVKLPHIISFIDLDSCTIDSDVFIFIVNDFADGGSLESWLDSNNGKANSHEHAIKITIEILTGLENLHEKGVTHRDLKPDNILIMNGKYCLADFGVSRKVKSHSKASGTAGTLEYMPPEAFNKNPSITAKTDIWAIGVILQRLLTGGLPYPQDEQPSLIAAILYGEPEKVSDDIPQKLQEIIEKCLQKEPNKRFKSAKELKESLEKFLRDLIKQRKTIEDEEFQKQQTEIENQRLKAEVEQAEKERIRVEEVERQRLDNLKRIEQAEQERQRIIEQTSNPLLELALQRISKSRKLMELAETERRRLIEIKRIEDEATANRLKKRAEEQKRKQAETEKFSFTALPLTKDWREIEREKDAEAKRRQADIDQLERDLFETPSRKLPIILAGGISLVILILTILGGGVFYNSLSSNSAKVANTNTNINKPSNISINSNLSISNVNVNANVNVNTANIKVTPTITPTPKIEIKATPLSTATPKATATSTPEIVKPTPKVEETPIVVATPQPTPKPVIVSTPRLTPKPMRKAKPQSAPKSDDCILTRSC